MAASGMSFDGRVVLITGGAGGIGCETAALFLALGASVFLTDVAEAGLQAQVQRLGASSRLRHQVADVRSSAAVSAVVAQCSAIFGGLDCLVNGAGIYPAQRVVDMSDDVWHEVQQINLDGTFYACRAAAALMRDGGSIVNLTSVAAHRGSKAHAHYAASKAGVLGLSRSLAQELAPRIRVNCVSPGPVATPMIKDIWATDADQLLATIPLGRICQPEEVAKAIVFLSSDWASYITAETLHVNGGLYVNG